MKKLILFLLPFSLCYSLSTFTPGTVTDLADTSGVTNTDGDPTVAASDSGQLIVAWSQLIGVDDVIQSKIFRSQTWVAVADIVSMNSLTNPTIGIDALGNAIIAFREINTLLGAILPANMPMPAWSSNATIDTDVGGRPILTTAPTGSTIVLWNTQSLPTKLLTNESTTTTNTWTSLASILTSTATPDFQPYYNPFDIPFAIFRSTFGPISLSVAEKTGALWSTFTPPLSTSSTATTGHMGFDSSGNAIAVWQEVITGDRLIRYSTFDGVSWSAAQSISSTPTGVANSQPTIGVDAAGNAVATWIQDDGGIPRVFASTYNGTSWSTPVAVSEAGFTVVDVEYTQVAVNSNGDAIVVWEDTNDGQNTVVVKAGFLPFGSTTWQLFTLSSTDTGTYAFAPDLAISPNGNVVIAWWFFTDPSFSTSYTQALNGLISTGPTPPPPPSILPPSSISGAKNENRFLFQSEFFDFIQWGASPSANVVNYKIYRNGTLIATVGSNTLNYTDHRVDRNSRNVYGVSAVNSSGDESSQIQVVVQ